MSRALALTDVAGFCALGFVVYKTVELGPYATAVLLGRCVHVFIVAAQVYL